MDNNATTNDNTTTVGPKTSIWRKLLPAFILVALAVAFFQSGLAQYISFDELAINYASITQFVSDQPLLAYLVAGAIYFLAVAIAFPAAWIFTVAYGLVFGLVPASFLVIISATLGACALYFVSGTLLTDFFRERAGKRLNIMAEGFRKNEVSYMFFLRLTPVFPFLLVNALPAVLGVSFITFAWTTALGIIPGTVAYISAGEGLRSVIAERATACAANIAPCGTPLSPSDLITREILIASALLALVSLLPIAVKKWRSRKTDNTVNQQPPSA